MAQKNVFVFLKSDTCRFCKDIVSKWDSIVLKLKQVDPNVMIETITMDNGNFDTTKYPKNIILYAKWFPMFLAIPYNLWEWALLNNNTNVDVNFKDGIQIFNGIWKNDKPEYSQIHSIKNNPGDSIAKWFKETLGNQEFLKVKNMTFKSESNNLIKSFINTPAAPIQQAAPVELVLESSVNNKDNNKDNNDDNETCSVKFKLLSRQEYKR
jgi:hypothetical protein